MKTYDEKEMNTTRIIGTVTFESEMSENQISQQNQGSQMAVSFIKFIHFIKR